MDYVICSPDRRTFIRLTKGGQPETCSKDKAQHFECEKAQNIVRNLPKTLKQFDFKACPIADGHSKSKPKQLPKVLKGYRPTSKKVKDWEERIKNCDNLIQDAMNRKVVLLKALSDANKEMTNLYHAVELEPWKNSCEGYKMYKAMKNTLERRRDVKDELIIVNAVLDSGIANVSFDKISEVINELELQYYTYRNVKESGGE